MPDSGSKKATGRAPIRLELQVRVLFRDKWLCHLCGYPTVFPLALKYLERFVAKRGIVAGPFAYYDFRYRHDASPMLDYLACVVDHRDAHARGGGDDAKNLVTACNKCNMRKSDQAYVDYVKKWPRRKVNARYGPPENWDGLASTFLTLAQEFQADLTAHERDWLKALDDWYASRSGGAGQQGVEDGRALRARRLTQQR
jgi:hypothetical protein